MIDIFLAVGYFFVAGQILNLGVKEDSVSCYLVGTFFVLFAISFVIKFCIDIKII